MDTNSARLLGAVEQAVRDLDKTLQVVIAKMDKQDDRISALERTRAWLAGAWAVLGAAIAFAATRMWPQ